jgi:Membrane protein involved in colicin uptake
MNIPIKFPIEFLSKFLSEIKFPSKIRITKKLIIVASVITTLVVAGGTVSAVSYTQHTEKLALDKQSNYIAAENTANSIVSDFSIIAEDVSMATETLCFVETSNKETLALAAEASATADAASEKTAKKKKEAEEKAKKEAEEKAAKEKAAKAAQIAKTTSSTTAGNNQASTNNDNGGGGSSSGLIAAASKYIGRNNMSCKELVWQAMADAGYPHSWTRSTFGPSRQVPWMQFKNYCSVVSISQMRAGDILESPGHVEIYLGNGMSIHGGYGLRGTGRTNVVRARATRNITRVYRPN